MKFQPQEGQQTKFLSTPADIGIYGGAAGGGKTYGLLLEPLRHLNVKGFESVIFRRQRPDITNPGGIWDESQQIYPHLGAVPREGGHLDWYVPGGLSVKFAHLQLDRHVYNWQGAQVGFFGWDELTHFTRKQFFYMISRLRSSTGIAGYMRATCNADAESWVAEFIAWWIDQDEQSPTYGYPIPERDGVLRWFIRQGDDLIWGDSKEALIEEYGEAGEHALSVTFIAAKVFDNKILMEKDPSYVARLNSLDNVEKMRLLHGNWKIKATAGEIFSRSMFEILPVAPTNIVKRIRYWDRAATKPSPSNPNPDWTAGVDMGITTDKQFIIFHVERFREGALQTQNNIKNTASSDSKARTIGLEQDPGQAGKSEAEALARELMGYNVKLFPVHKDKVTRAVPYSAQAQANNVKLVKGAWNEAFLKEHEAFPPDESKRKRSVDGKEDEEGAGKDDQVDAASGAFNYLTGDKVGKFPEATSKSTTTTIAPGFSVGKHEW